VRPFSACENECLYQLSISSVRPKFYHTSKAKLVTDALFQRPFDPPIECPGREDMPALKIRRKTERFGIGIGIGVAIAVGLFTRIAIAIPMPIPTPTITNAGV
jgi:hypothetical protein